MTFYFSVTGNCKYVADRAAAVTGDECVMCPACLHRCPKFAIQFGSKTAKHGQYFAV